MTDQLSKKILIVEDEYIIADVLRNLLQNAGYDICGIADSVDEALELIEINRPNFVLLDIYLKGKLTGIDLANQLTEENIPFVYLSANSNQSILEEAKKTNPYGFIVKPFREKDVLVALDIAVYRHENNLENKLRQNAALQKKVARIIDLQADWTYKLMQIGQALQPYIPFEYLSVGLKSNDNNNDEIGFMRIGFEEYQTIGPKELMVITNKKSYELSALKGKSTWEQLATWYDEKELQAAFNEQPMRKLITETFSMKSLLVFPVPLSGNQAIYFFFYGRRPDAYDSDHLILCDQFRNLIGDFAQIMVSDSKSPLGSNPVYNGVHRTAGQEMSANLFAGIIGSSHLLLNVFDNVQQVAPADSSVLILGESGTGKERIAERIHYLSPRKSKPFIKVNCAALPATLIDSELFGHEKGSFTGAFERKIGRFEQAHTGTLFLDEIGEIPLELQVKLLRVLQEKEIERIGGRTTIKTDVRIIAATNRNLEMEVAEGRFRLDLYYRLNVFPIVMPPLRERKEDIPALANHFLIIYSRKTGKAIKGLSEKVLESMQTYRWPGNIRELENLIERSVLLAKSDFIDTIALPFQTEQPAMSFIANASVQTMKENEKTHILRALNECGWKIWGPGGAARLLNLPPTTLNSKMKKLGITRSFQK
ncbi:sigma 54-interacting response regulator [Mucilaginibacter gossypii]|uniref:sigma 54-interacting response regulator n=1 Tax=Mucilaginibacter gossypii TaxID=551996 RepID=UPI000DCEB3F4|nr:MULTISPECIES: sigma 54-interacting response regulator [Mucilaginibacter]QTE40434.2 sigma 54-interacting response regulator [Mucilaginibacter gossypii]RAV54024.1 DNA-binding response regulator [Mucilaginibacter rubeus]